MITLQDLHPQMGARQSRKRLGRGIGSGTGKTAGKGHKGQTARRGGQIARGFEGGQTPLYRRLPKRGFRNMFRTAYEVVTVERLNCFAAGTEVSVSMLKEKGMVSLTKNKKLKIIGARKRQRVMRSSKRQGADEANSGKLDRSLVVSAHKFTKGAREAITAAGGQCREL